jgi:hypothetical protein
VNFTETEIVDNVNYDLSIDYTKNNSNSDIDFINPKKLKLDFEYTQTNNLNKKFHLD